MHSKCVSVFEKYCPADLLENRDVLRSIVDDAVTNGVTSDKQRKAAA